MKHPNFNEEKKLWKQGYDFVGGLDEAGRGPLAGPVVASVVIVRQIVGRSTSHNFNLTGLGIRDSKKLSAKQRENFYNILTNHKSIKWGVGVVSEKMIDKINILQATKLAMQKALANLGRPIRTNMPIGKNNIDFLLIDGNFAVKSKILQKSIIRGDEKIFSCAAASIIAKVTRDRIMQKMHKKYPQYGFDSHKGYGTALHIKNLKNFGPCKVHRKTFSPVKSYLDN